MSTLSGGERALTGVRRISKPGLRVYAKRHEVPRVLGGLGTAIIPTPSGLMTDRPAGQAGVGRLQLGRAHGADEIEQARQPLAIRADGRDTNVEGERPAAFARGGDFGSSSVIGFTLNEYRSGFAPQPRRPEDQRERRKAGQEAPSRLPPR